ncbi:MAG: hypothetical protein R3309_15360, partial [Reinekea sp.]|nr:hypothetical protein [Reinekea sp.]
MQGIIPATQITKNIEVNVHSDNFFARLVLVTALATGSHSAFALTEMSDDSLSDVQGAGLAFALDDFRLQAAPTTYIEQIGGAPAAGTSFARGDLRWFGATISNWSASEAAGDRTTWNGTCGDGYNHMGCPISFAGIANYANHDNPFLLRVFEYQRVGLDPAAVGAGGDWLGSPVANGISAGGVNRTVLELLGPSDSQDWRWAFWGEIQSSTTNADGSINSVFGLLRNQNLIIGKPASYMQPTSIAGTGAGNPHEGAVLRLFQFRGDRENGAGTVFLDETMGLIYHHRLSGDYRFSVNQIVGAQDSDAVPRFTDYEGLYFNNVEAYLPLGTMFYQAIVLDSVNPGDGSAGDGNFIIELTRIPNDSNAFNDFYSSSGQSGYQRAGRNDRYYETHGYVEWGGYFPQSPCQLGVSGATNCVSGSGTNDGLRWSGPGYDSSTPQTVTLPARVVNVT